MTGLTENNPLDEQGSLVNSRESPGAEKHAESGIVAVEEHTTDVDQSTISTTEPSPQNTGGGQVDGSVASAITDHTPLGGAAPVLPSNLMGNPLLSQSSLSVPEQVILPDNDSRPHSYSEAVQSTESLHNETAPAAETPLVVTEEAPETSETVSLSALPDPKNSLEPAVGKQPLHDRHTSAGPVATTPISAEKQSSQRLQQQDFGLGNGSEDSSMDEYIKSPEVQNAIVERSPGGRYVRFMEKLGSGASKDVYRAYDTQEGIEVAWNVVILSGVPKSERNRVVNEVRLLERLHHTNIISFHGSWVNRERQEVNFVTEILSSGTLKSFIAKVQVIRWKIAKRWATQILKGLEYLHSQDPPVIHRDLKCENIFINGTSGDLRIGDLGLSTVHRNGRVLSVLGTPEFMAPDMYEDRSYDEKVDIYAFGMCMLEILTKEIPYGECNNPAQIYKKVSSGEPPEVLTRLQSRHAREFVEFCMGYKDENGVYIRPSATELLKHPFLMKRQNDDDEVVVNRPLRETVIRESGESNGSSLLRRSMNAQTTSSAATSTRRNPAPSSLSSEDDEGKDQFDDMPESETNMKKVKVMMGRDEVLVEDETEAAKDADPVVITPQAPLASQQQPGQPVSAAPQPAVHPPPAAGDTVTNQNTSVYAAQGPTSPAPKSTTQSVQSQMQHPSVPNSETAQAASYQPPAPASQPRHTQYTTQPAEQLPQEGAAAQGADVSKMHYLVAAAVINEEADVRPYADDILKLVVTLPVEGQTQNVQFDFHLVEDDPVQVGKEMVQELGIPPEAILEVCETISGLARTARMKQDKYTVRMQNSQVQQNPAHPPPPIPQEQSATQQNPSSQLTAPSSDQPVSHEPVNAGHGNPEPQLHHANGTSPPTAPLNGALPSPAAVLPPQPIPQAVSGQHTAPASAPQLAQQPLATSNAVPTELNQNQPGHLAQPSPLNPPQAAPNMQAAPISAPTTIQLQDPQNHLVQSNIPPPPQGLPPSAPASQPASPIPIKSVVSNSTHSTTTPSVDNGVRSSSFRSTDQSQSTTSLTGLSPNDQDLTVGSDDDEVKEQLRKLEEDYQKNLKIARKVFDSRMENLERSRKEKEAQRQETLEKHEKERLAFEKRRAQEEEQQMRRIEQLQKEWDKKRETLSQRAVMNASAETMTKPQEALVSQVPVNGIYEHVAPGVAAAPAGSSLPSVPSQLSVASAASASSEVQQAVSVPQQQQTSDDSQPN